MTETFIFNLSRKTRPNTLRAGNQMISANDRMHHHVKAQITSYLRRQPHELYVNTFDDMPRFNTENPCIVTINVKPPTRRRMDAPNWYPTVKALVDGFVDLGYLSDDNNSIIKETRFKSTDLSHTGEYILELTFEEVSDA